MKKVIIIILAVLLAIDIGVIAYGFTGGPEAALGNAPGLLEKPSETIYVSAENYMSLAEMTSATDPAERVAKLLLNTTYNLIESKGFYSGCRTDIVAEDGSTSVSESFLAVQEIEGGGVNEVSQMLTSSTQYGRRTIYYYNEKLNQKDYTKGCVYYKATGVFKTKLNSPESTTRGDSSKKGKTTYVMYSWFDFPLYLGGKDDPSKAGDLVWDSIDGSSVKVKNETDYSTWTFSVNLDKANEYEDTYHYLSYGSLSGNSGGGAVDHINSMTYEVSVWKSGIFRKIVAKANFDGKVAGQKGKATITKTYEFSYDDAAISAAYWLHELGWANALKNDSDKAKYDTEVAAFAELFEAKEKEKTK